MLRYNCPYCRTPIRVGKLKQLKVCDCGKVINLSHIRTKNEKRNSQSVLDRILSIQDVQCKSVDSILSTILGR